MKTNKYHKWYDQLIDRARNRTIEGYVERHHIVPRSLGGTDEESNLVDLTAREHLIAHMLLVRFVENKAPMWFAVWGMMNKNRSRVICNAKVYEQARLKYVAIRTGKNHSPETRAKISITKRSKPITPESRAVRSAAQKGKKLSPESIAKRTATQAANRAANAARGIFRKPHSIETRARIRDTLKATRAAIQLANIGKPEVIVKRSPETLAKMSAAQKGKKRSPESIAKRQATRAANRALKLSRLNQLTESSNAGIRESGVPL